MYINKFTVFLAKAGLQISNIPKVVLQMWIQRGGSSISQTPTSKAFSGCLLRTFKSHPSGSNKMPSDLEEKDEFFFLNQKKPWEANISRNTFLIYLRIFFVLACCPGFHSGIKCGCCRLPSKLRQTEPNSCKKDGFSCTKTPKIQDPH